jgi:hypothetical protein
MSTTRLGPLVIPEDGCGASAFALWVLPTWTGNSGDDKWTS